MDKQRTIGVLTSGGDAPGMNAAIRAVVRTGIFYGMRVMMIKRGYSGLVNGEVVEANLRSVGDIIQRGGTFLGTSRCPEFMTVEGREKAAVMAKIYGITDLVVIGGDGSFRGAKDFTEQGMNVYCIPGTIDNDVGCSEYTIGYDTALNTALNAIDKLRDTSLSHDRCSVVEVMGRHAGYIAVTVGIACGADAVLVPEIKYDLDRDVIVPLIESRNKGKKHFIVIIAEGVGKTSDISAMIEKCTGVEARPTILGHVQRGGIPSCRDREVASRMGVRAVEVISEGRVNRVIAVRQNKIVDLDICEALNMKKTIPEHEFEISSILSK